MWFYDRKENRKRWRKGSLDDWVTNAIRHDEYLFKNNLLTNCMVYIYYNIETVFSYDVINVTPGLICRKQLC